MSARAGPFAARAWGHAGYAALICLAGSAWLLIVLARVAAFSLWPLALLPLLAALALGGIAWLRCDRFDRLAALGLLLLAALLYLPPAQHIALSGDAAIYPNEAFYLLRTGRLNGVHEALAALSPESRDLFVVDSDEQFGGVVIPKAYDGILYGGYYVSDAEQAEITSSRMPQAIVWMALAAAAAGPAAPFFVSFFAACVALLALYALAAQVIARHADSRWVALWSTVLLAITYTQIYLARQPLSEVTGQVWTLAGFCAAVSWLQTRRPAYLILAAFFWVTAWSARLDAILLAGPAVLLLVVAAHDRDRRALVSLVVAALPLFALAWLGTNAAYTAATRQLVFAIYDVLTPVVLAGAIAAVTALAAAWIWGARVTRTVRGRPAQIAGWLLFALAAFVILWSTVPNPLRTPGVTRPWQEIPWFSSLYVTPLLFWLALAGFGLTLWRGGNRAQVFVIASWFGLSAAYFYTYTTSPVYPIALRRLASDLLPLTAVVAGLAIVKLPPWRWRTMAQAGIAALALVWVALLSWPLASQHEARRDMAFVSALHEALPADAVVLFEPQDDDSWVGWLAAPLFSVYGDWSLLLESDTPDADLLASAVRQLQMAGRKVFVASQSPTLPGALLPAGYSASPFAEMTWNSSLIGQTRAPYPPPYWEFNLPVYLYGLEGE